MEKVSRELDKALELMHIYGNRVRFLIMGLLKAHPKKEMSITDLKEEIDRIMKKEYDYKSIHYQIKFLEHFKLIKLNKQTKVKHQPVLVTLTDKGKLPIYITQGDNKIKLL